MEAPAFSHTDTNLHNKEQWFSLAPPYHPGFSSFLTFYWPLTKFWRSLVMFDFFWDFDRLVEGGVQV
jgi:hypothetical protein